MGSFRMWVVGVAPVGRCQDPSCQSRAVFSCAPAMLIRKCSAATGSRAFSLDSELASSSATCRVLSRTPVIGNGFPGLASSGSNCRAPTQSRPIACSRSNGLVLSVRNRRWILSRIARLSGSRLSKNDSTPSRKGSLEGLRGNEREIGRAWTEEIQVSA